MKYQRYFIPLVPDSKGFELSAKEPLGRCVIDDWGKKSKLSLWVQDLKVGTPYKVVLILSDMGKYSGVELGALYVDSKGKSEFKTEFDPTGLADGQGLLRLCAITILAVEGKELLCPLVGFKDGPVIWKNHFSLLGDEKEQKEQVEEAVENNLAENQQEVESKLEDSPIQDDANVPVDNVESSFDSKQEIDEAEISQETKIDQEFEALNNESGNSQDAEPTDGELDRQDAEPMVDEAENTQDIEPMVDEAEKAHDVESMDDEAEKAQNAELLGNEAEDVQDTEPMDDETESAQDIEPVDSEAENSLEMNQDETVDDSEMVKGDSVEPDATVKPDANVEQISPSISVDEPLRFIENETRHQTEPDEKQDGESTESNPQEYADSHDFFEGLTDYPEEQTQQAHKRDVNIVDKEDYDVNQPEEEEKPFGSRDVKDIFNNNIEITPFDSQSADTQWVRISLREPVFLPINYRLTINHPLVVAAYKKYNHLILGRVTSEAKIDYVLGVPGIFETQYVSAVKQLGFTQFKTVIDSGILRPGDYGYWLCPVQMPEEEKSS